MCSVSNKQLILHLLLVLPVMSREQGWRSGESTSLPLMWLGIDSQTQRNMWVEFVVGSLLFFYYYYYHKIVIIIVEIIVVNKCVPLNSVFPLINKTLDFCYHTKFVNLNCTFSAALDTPHFGIHPTNKIVGEYLPALLQCQILGVPPPTIYWTFNGQPLQNAFDRYLLGNGSLYFTAPVNHSYSGQYACSGTNSKGSISSRAVLFRVACK